MSDYEKEDKKKSRDIFGILGDLSYESTQSYYGFWNDVWSYKYGLAGAVLGIIFVYGPDMFTDGYAAMITFGLILSYTLIHYYVYEIENDEDSALYKIMNFLNMAIVITVVCIFLYFVLAITLGMFQDAGVIR